MEQMEMRRLRGRIRLREKSSEDRYMNSRMRERRGGTGIERKTGIRIIIYSVSGRYNNVKELWPRERKLVRILKSVCFMKKVKTSPHLVKSFACRNSLSDLEVGTNPHFQSSSQSSANHITHDADAIYENCYVAAQTRQTLYPLDLATLIFFFAIQRAASRGHVEKVGHLRYGECDLSMRSHEGIQRRLYVP
ncbi:hypothetical protein EVAR_94193_1 [Eumeta japonica]|uniref:Uncharacterized protein n=1 Tax=Eumeta variegata TaxID=151549 RepID=A0A4C1UNN1_EUMVA|nr:hypothetical protein EVAR_94193_1 [Eumeta japonica]